MIRVLVWNEYEHEKKEEAVRAIYPAGIHNAIADFLRAEDVTVRTATLDDPECGLTWEVLRETDVLLWWGHHRHGDVPDEVAQRVQEAVLQGMGAIFLHSAHKAKPFMRLMGTSCDLVWREIGERERLWVTAPNHPITQGIHGFVDIPHEEMYGEYFHIPQPDEQIFIGWYQGGEVFRSGCCYNRGYGRVFYFQPGHETFPIYHQPEIQTILKNAVRWAAPASRIDALGCIHRETPLEQI